MQRELCGDCKEYTMEKVGLIREEDNIVKEDDRGIQLHIVKEDDRGIQLHCEFNLYQCSVCKTIKIICE